MTATWSTTLWLDDVSDIDVVAYGLAQMLWQYRGDQPRLQGALEALLDEVENFQRVTLEVMTERWPLTAIGTQLDTIGKIVGQPRASLTDDEYRMFILARILVNRCNGRVEELIDILTAVGVTEPILITTHTGEIRIDITGFAQGRLLGTLMREAKPGGGTLLWVWNTTSETNAFALGTTLGTHDTDANRGFANVAGTTGGVLSRERVY